MVQLSVMEQGILYNPTLIFPVVVFLQYEVRGITIG